MDVDEVLCSIGEYGRYQKILLFLVCIPCVLPAAFFSFNQLYMIDLSSECCFNSTVNGSCSSGYDPSVSNIQNYDQEILICEDQTRVTWSLTTIGIAGIAGSFISSFVQERIGYRPSYFIFLFVGIISSIASTFAIDYWTWMVGRFMVASIVPMMLTTAYVIPFELVGPRYRTRIMVWFSSGMLTCMLVLALVVSRVRNWQTLSLVTSVPLIAYIFFWRMLPESPRWQLAKGRYDEAISTLQKISNMNGKRLKEEHAQKLKEYFISQRKSPYLSGPLTEYSMKDLFCRSSLRKITIFITILRYCCFSVSGGLQYYIPVLSKGFNGNKYDDFLIISLLQIPIFALTWPIVERLGRRHSVCYTMVTSGMASIVVWIMQDTTVTKLLVFGIGKSANFLTTLAITLFTSELYPTPVRGNALFYTAIVDMIGFLTIPFITQEGSGNHHALLILGLISIVGGLPALLLKETKDKHLQDTIIEENETMI